MLIETAIKLAVKILIILAGCVACLLCVLPLYGSYNYTIGGICTGIVVAAVLAWHVAQDGMDPAGVGLVLGGAWIAGVFWPVTVIVGLWLWLRKSGGWGGRGGPGVLGRPAAA